jgi:tetratricopeptide (TPR) repeat protein
MRLGWIATLALCAGLASADDGVWPRFQAGVKAYHRGDFEAAQASFESVVRRQSKFGDAHYYLGVLAERRNDLRGAVRRFKSVETKWPMYVPSQQRLGQIALRLRDQESALHYLGNVVAVRPTVNAWMQLAALQLDMKKHKDAEASLKACAKLTKGNLSVIELEARLYVETGRHKMAHDAYSTILKVMPRDATVRYLRALCLIELGLSSDAVREMEAVLKYDPYHKGAIHHLLKTYAHDPVREKQVAELQARLERLRKHPPKVRQVSGK